MMVPVGSGPLAGQIAAAAAEQMNTRAKVEAGVSALAPREVPKGLIRAVRAELQALLRGNLEDNLTQVEQVAVRARELFMSIKGPGSQFVRGGPTQSVMTVNGPQIIGGSAASYSGGSAVFPASYSNPEQFGASAIRQLVNLVPEIMSAQANTPDKLMAAIALAEEKGHDDIAKALKKKLMGSDYGDEPKQLAPHDTLSGRRQHDAHDAHETHEHESNDAASSTTIVGAALVEAGTAMMGAAQP